MQHPRWPAYLIVMLAVVLSICWCLAAAVPVPEAYQNRTIIVAVDNSYPPFSFLDGEGNLVGIDIDQWNLWEKKTGIPVKFVTLESTEPNKLIKTGGIDVNSEIFYTPERAEYIDFSEPYEPVIDVSVYFKKSLSGISDVNSLKGFVVAVVAGYDSEDYLKNRGITIKGYPSVEAIVLDAKAGNVLVFCTDKPAAVYYLYKYGMYDDFRETPPLYSDKLRRGVKKGNTELLGIINAGFAQISESEYKEIEHRWFGSPVSYSDEIQLLVSLATGAVLIAIACVIGLAFWNRSLSSAVEKKTVELSRKTAELRASYEQLTATGEELKRNYDELKKSQQALEQARRKLNLLNTIAFSDIRNAAFSLSGYFELEKRDMPDKEMRQYLEKEIEITQKIIESLQFAKNYQDLGLQPPAWQNVAQSFLYGVSHFDFTKLSRNLDVGGLEVYADPLLERVFVTLSENVILHGKTATMVSLRYQETGEGLTIIFEDNGVGISDDMKENIFNRKYEEKKGLGLFLAREILSITGIHIKETGEFGKGARFEIFVPRGTYRFTTG
jgi:ABC-type amino acid transport substrate-binding protein/cell division protein FtsB